MRNGLWKHFWLLNCFDFWIVLPFWITLKYKAHPVHLLPPSLWVTVAYGSLSRMITKKDQGGAVGFDSHYRSRPFRIPYKSNLCTNIIMIHSVAKKFPKLFHKIFFDTGKSFSEGLIFASSNPQYDDRLFIELQVQYMKILRQEHVENMCSVYIHCSECQNKNKKQFLYTTCSPDVLSLYFSW